MILNGSIHYFYFCGIYNGAHPNYSYFCSSGDIFHTHRTCCHWSEDPGCGAWCCNVWSLCNTRCTQNPPPPFVSEALENVVFNYLEEMPWTFLRWLSRWCLVLKTMPQISHGRYKDKWAASMCFLRSVLCEAFLPHSVHSQHWWVSILEKEATCSSISESEGEEKLKLNDNRLLNKVTFAHNIQKGNYWNDDINVE